MAKKELTDADVTAAVNLKRLLNDWQARRMAGGQKKLSQEEIGAEIGLTQGMVSHILVAREPMSRRTVIRFSRLLGVNPEEIHPAFASMVAEPETIYSSTPTGETHHHTQEEIETVATQYAFIFTDIAESIINNDLPREIKAEIFQKMKARYVQQLIEGQQLPNLDKMESEVADFMYFYKLRRNAS